MASSWVLGLELGLGLGRVLQHYGQVTACILTLTLTLTRTLTLTLTSKNCPNLKNCFNPNPNREYPAHYFVHGRLALFQAPVLPLRVLVVLSAYPYAYAYTYPYPYPYPYTYRYLYTYPYLYPYPYPYPSLQL